MILQICGVTGLILATLFDSYVVVPIIRWLRNETKPEYNQDEEIGMPYFIVAIIFLIFVLFYPRTFLKLTLTIAVLASIGIGGFYGIGLISGEFSLIDPNKGQTVTFDPKDCPTLKELNDPEESLRIGNNVIRQSMGCPYPKN